MVECGLCSHPERGDVGDGAQPRLALGAREWGVGGDVVSRLERGGCRVRVRGGGRRRRLDLGRGRRRAEGAGGGR